jgi:hypothetical protein
MTGSLGEHLFEERCGGGIELKVQCGHWVKVGRHRERFWCRVTDVRADGSIVARVANDLLNSNYQYGDELVLRRRHVLEVASLADSLTFRCLAAELGTVNAAVVWRAVRET